MHKIWLWASDGLGFRVQGYFRETSFTKRVQGSEFSFVQGESSSKVLSLAGEAIARVSAAPWRHGHGSGCCSYLVGTVPLLQEGLYYDMPQKRQCTPSVRK